MKSKIILLAAAAITLLSFTLISTTKTSQKEATKQEANVSHSGFAMQDSNQF